MGWYWLLCSDERRGRSWFQPAEAFFAGITPVVQTVGRVRALSSCIEIRNWDREFSYVRSTSADRDAPADDVMYFDSDFPIFSPRLRKAMDDASLARGDVQYLPIRVIQSTGDVLEGFSVVNVLSKLRALNVKESKFVDYDMKRFDPTTGMPEIAIVGKPVLTSAVNEFGGDMFRLAEHLQKVFVSERFAKEFAKSAYSGARLVPVEVK